MLPSLDPAERCWLIGLFEAEGSFMAGSPSSPSQLALAIQMTDADVMQSVATLLETTLMGPYRGREAHYKPSCQVRIRGRVARELMAGWKPAMSQRRQQQIAKAMASPSPRGNKLCLDDARMIRRLRAERDWSSIQLAERFGITRDRINSVLRGEIWPEPVVRNQIQEAALLADLATFEHAWVAGYLKGEGCFTDSHRPRITVQSTDRDVLERLARRWGTRARSVRERNRSWSPAYTVAVCGEDAAREMIRIAPFMGERRGSRIESILRQFADRVSAGNYGPSSQRLLSDDDVALARDLLAEGHSFAAIGRVLGVHRAHIHQIATGRTYKSPQRDLKPLAQEIHDALATTNGGQQQIWAVERAREDSNLQPPVP